MFRIREKSGFGVGVQHVVDVLCGAESEKVRRFGHETLSTYGIGKEHSRADWAAIGRELVRLGYLNQNAAAFNSVELTAAIRQFTAHIQAETLCERIRFEAIAGCEPTEIKIAGQILTLYLKRLAA